jgi:hypothetical protein
MAYGKAYTKANAENREIRWSDGVMEWWSDGWLNLTITPSPQFSSTPTLRHSKALRAQANLQ